MSNSVTWFEVAGKDGKKLQSFYADLFDWKVDDDNPMDYGMVEAGEGGIPGGVTSSPDGSAHLTFYVQVPNLQAALDKAEALGGKTVTSPMDVPDGPSIAHFTDPEGNFVGLLKG